MRRSYPALAGELGLECCSGVRRTGFYCRGFDHRAGSAEAGCIHLVDIRVTKPGLARFLKLAAIAQDPDLNEEVPWRRVYLLYVRSRQLAGRLRVRMPPKEVYAHDRAFVRAGTAGMPNNVALRREAFNWARR